MWIHFLEWDIKNIIHHNSVCFPTITIQKLLKESLKALRSFQEGMTMEKVVHGHQDIFGVSPNIHNLKAKEQCYERMNAVN